MKFPPLSQLTTDLFALPPTAQRQSNLCSMVNFYPEIKRLMDVVSMSSITEIGSEAGENTAALLEYARTRNLQLTTVDPIDVPFPFDRNTTPFFTFFRGTSRDYLQGNYQCTVMFMDGDHNYETVLDDLTAIHNRRQESGIKIIFLHDVSWPWARRDLYYSLDRVKNPHPNQSQTMVSPYQSESQYYLPSTGYNAANSEGSQHNGVLTAVEDFVAEHNTSWQYWHIPVIYGIGILVCQDNVPENEYNTLSGLIRELLSHREILATLELNRIENLCYIQSLKDEIQHAGDVWRSDQRYIDEVNTHLSDFTQKLNSINSQFEFLQKIDSEKNARIEELRNALNFNIENGKSQKDTVSKLLQQIQQLQAQFEHEKNECSDLQKEVKSLTEQIFQLELDKNNADHTILELKNSQAVTEQKLQEETELHLRQIEQLQSQFDLQKNECSDLQKEVKSLTEQIFQLKLDKNNADQTVLELKNSQAVTEQKLREETELRRSCEDALQKSSAEHDEITAKLNRTLSEKENENALLQEQLAHKEQRVTHLDTLLEKATGERDCARQQTEAEQQANERIRASLLKREDENKNLLYQIIQSEKTVSSLNDQLQNALNKQQENAAEISHLNAEKDSLRNECDATHVEVWKRDQEIRRLNLENLSEHWRIAKRSWLNSITYGQCNKKKFAKMKAMLLSGQIKLLSLDVFDTLLMRCRHSELQRFMDMGKLWNKKFPTITEKSFYAARALAHRIAYQSQTPVQGCREPQASAIFKQMCSILNLADEDAETLAAMELEYETAHLRLNPAVAELIKIAKEQNIKVIAVSDMYWKSDAIGKLIEKAAGNDFIMDRVYSSSDTGISKSSGLLFDYVLKEEQCAPSAMLHIGDNKESDCVRPYLRHGINAVWIPRPAHYNNYCKKQQKRYMKQLKKRGIINGL